jgi:hypothetical protein
MEHLAFSSIPLTTLIIGACLLASLVFYSFYIITKPQAAVPFIICSFWFVIIEPAFCDIFAAIAIGAMFLKMSVYKENSNSLLFSEFMFVAFVISNYPILVFTDDFFYSLRHFAITLFLFALFFFISRITDSLDQIRKQLLLYFIPTIITSVAMICASTFLLFSINVSGFQDILLEGNRPRGFFKDPNVAGPFLIPSAIYSLSVILNSSSRKKFTFFLLLFVSSTGVLLSFSRAAVGSLLISMVLVTALSFNMSRMVRNVIYLLLGLSFIVLVTFVSPYSKISTRLFDTDYGVDKRISRIERSLHVIKQNILVGSGMLEQAEIGDPHDTYFLLLKRYGIGGFLTFWIAILYIAGKLLLYFKQSKNDENKIIFLSLGVSIIAFLPLGCVMSFLHWRHFWFFSGLGTATIHIVKRNDALLRAKE